MNVIMHQRKSHPDRNEFFINPVFNPALLFTISGLVPESFHEVILKDTGKGTGFNPEL